MRVKEYQSNSIVKFGRYNGKTLSEIVDIEPDYIEWCIMHLDHFYISEEAVESLVEINTDFTVSAEMQLILEEKAKNVYTRSRSNDDYDKPSYGQYAGSYAQDQEGWSDNDINDAFDGFADAYWNID